MTARHLVSILSLLTIALPGIMHAGDLAPRPPLELVVTVPTETEVGAVGLPEADAAWTDMIDGAERTVFGAFFYASMAPDTRLERVVSALERASNRGVAIRFLLGHFAR